MKKLLLVCGLALFGLQSISAQDEESWAPRQLGIGVGVGTTGVVIDASTTMNRWLGFRVGVDIFPKITVNTDLDLETDGMNKQVSQLTSEIQDLNTKLAAAGMEQVDLNRFPGGNLPNSMDVQGKWKNTTFHFLIDVYPFKNSSFHATTGFYIGSKEIVSVYNKDAGFLQPIVAYNRAIENATSANADLNVKNTVEQYGLKMIGAELGDYFITPDPADKGDVKATIEVNAFRPYLGIGFGRAVPKTKRIGCQFDMGVQFWGTPKVYAPVYDKATGTYYRTQLEDDHAGGDGGDVIKTISKISVYPTLNFRLVGRIL